jgi:ribosomal protein S18 acetylase RimI-like enzyme
MDRHDPGNWFLQAIAVEREARERGIGTALLAAGFEQARTSDSDRLTLDVDVETGRGRALYERFGLRVTATSKPARLLGGAAVHRMSAEL